MSLFKIEKSIAHKLEAIPVKKEKDIQKIFEDNLTTLLNIDFLATEYSTSFGGRIDSLGIDKQGSPVIIEYKKTQNDNVINQGLSYLKWLLDHKAEFEGLCRKKNISIGVDWASPRVICVAESYNKFDLDTVDIVKIKIELLKYRIYSDNILLLESESQPPVTISTSKIFEKAKKGRDYGVKLQKEYTIDEHVQIASKEIRELFWHLRELIMTLDKSIIEEPKAKYIAYKLTTNFVDLNIQKNAIKAYLNVPSGKLHDPLGIARDLSTPKKTGHWGNGDYEVVIKTRSEAARLFDLIKESYNFNK